MNFKFSTLFTVMVFFSQMIFAQHLTYEQKKEYLRQENIHFDDKTATGDVSKPQTHEQVTLAMLNCPVGLYRTYEDFVNQKPEALVYQNFSMKGGSFKGYTGTDVVFKDGAGKKVTVSCDEFWGFKDKDGYLWRNGKFASSGGTFALPFSVEYVSDYIEYHPCPYSNCSYKPFEWCSGDLKSPLLHSDYYHKNNKTLHDKVSKYQTDCDAKAPRGINQWIAKCESCELLCPYLRFVFVHDPKKSDAGAFEAAAMPADAAPGTH
jgi:hypothetical protein